MPTSVIASKKNSPFSALSRLACLTFNPECLSCFPHRPLSSLPPLPLSHLCFLLGRWRLTVSYHFSYATGRTDIAQSRVPSGASQKTIKQDTFLLMRPNRVARWILQIKGLRQPRYDQLVVIPSPAFTRRKDINEILMHASRQDKHRRVPHLLRDRRSTPLDLIKGHLVFSRSNEHARKNASKPSPPVPRRQVRLNLVAQRRRDARSNGIR